MGRRTMAAMLVSELLAAVNVEWPTSELSVQQSVV